MHTDVCARARVCSVLKPCQGVIFHLAAGQKDACWLDNLLNVVNTHTWQHGDLCYYVAFTSLFWHKAQPQTKYTALTYPNSSALNTGREGYLWHRRYCSHGSLSASLPLEHLLSFHLSFLSLPSLCNLLLLFPLFPFLHLPFSDLLLLSEHQRYSRGLPSHLPPHRSLHLLQTEGSAKANCGFQSIFVLLYISRLLLCPGLCY